MKARQNELLATKRKAHRDREARNNLRRIPR
jgi:hypothetical protein